MLSKLQDPAGFCVAKVWLKVVAPYFILTNCIEAIKSSLSSSHPVVALACKMCNKQYLDLEDYAQ